MSWNYASRALVSTFSQIPQNDLLDEYSDWAESLIDLWTGTTYTGTTTYTAEKHDGDDSGVVFVDHPPIVSVSSLSVDDSALTTSDYKVYSEWIKLVSTAMTEVSTSLYQESVFAKGEQNISITYVGGSATVPAYVKLAATQMISLIAMVSKREGSDASLKYSRVSRNDGDSMTTTENFGLQSGLMNILKNYVPRGWKMR